MPTRAGPDGLPVRQFASPGAWEQWLEENHAAAPGVWLRLAKKSSKRRTVTYEEAVETALCYGWIDGQMRRDDDDFVIQRFTPRRPRSNWSPTNRQKAMDLITAGRMRPAGLAEVERARRDGRWEGEAPPSADLPG